MATTYGQRRKYRNELEKNATVSEMVFRKRLRSARIKHEFQRVLGPFIVDFWVARKMLVIEIDGGYHDTSGQRAYDNRRDAFFQGFGITTIRIPNEQVHSWPIEIIKNIPELKPRGIHIRRIERFMNQRNRGPAKQAKPEKPKESLMFKCSCGTKAILHRGQLASHQKSGKDDLCPYGNGI